MSQRNTLPVCSGLNIKQNRHTTKTAVCALTLKMEAVCSSEILAGFYQTTQQHIPEDGTLDVKRLQKMGKEHGQF
jgi:hypothetical protein